MPSANDERVNKKNLFHLTEIVLEILTDDAHALSSTFYSLITRHRSRPRDQNHLADDCWATRTFPDAFTHNNTTKSSKKAYRNGTELTH